MKKLSLIMSVLFFSFNSFAADVTISWDANTESDLAGYKIYYDVNAGPPYNGTESTQGVSPITIPLSNLSDNTNPKVNLNGFDPFKDYYFVVTAYDNETPSLESAYSNEVVVTCKDKLPPLPVINIIVNCN